MMWLLISLIIIAVIVGLVFLDQKKKEQEIIILIGQEMQQRSKPIVNNTVYSTGYSYGGNDTIVNSSCGLM